MSKTFLIACPEHCDICAFDSIDDVTAKIRALQDEEAKIPLGQRIFMFQGERLYLTKGNVKYLVLPDGTKKPIHIEPQNPEIDEDGYLVESDRTSIMQDEVKKEDSDYLAKEPTLDSFDDDFDFDTDDEL